MSENQFAELESLLFDWESGTLDDDGVNRFREILHNNKAAREHYARLQLLTAAMKLDGDSGLNLPVDQIASHSQIASDNQLASPDQVTSLNQLASQTQSKSRRKVAANGWLIAAALLSCILIGRLAFLEFSTRTQEAIAETSAEATSQGVAIVTRLVDAVWEPDGPTFEPGEALSPCHIALQSGFVQIEFFCGATIILEGPAELELQSATHARIHSGRLRAQVPPAARGFSVFAGTMKVVDLGTEFGLSISDKGANVQVFDGEVELREPDTDVRNLTTGQALTRSPTGNYAKTDLAPNSFVDIATLESRSQDQRTARYHRWKSASEKLRRDPRLIAYYAFEDTNSHARKLLNSTEPTNTELDGAIVGASRTTGRWLTRSALEFKRPADRVRVQVPGEFSSLTFAAWVRIDSLDRQYNSLFLTDNYNVGEPHWQILDNGQIYFSVRPTKRGHEGPADYKSRSKPFWNPSLSGKWLHLAVVYDVQNQTITHYLNGRTLSSEDVPAEQIVKTTRIGTASIGNWAAPTMPDAKFAIRNLNGRIDELALFAAALSDNEVASIYKNGKP